MRDYILLDIETTSKDSASCSIVSINMLRYKGKGKHFELNSNINPLCDIEIGASMVHGKTASSLKDSPTLSEYMEEIYKQFKQTEYVITYNGENFDLKVLHRLLSEGGYEDTFENIKSIDVYRIARDVLKDKIVPWVKDNDKTGFSLSNVYRTLFNTEISNHHDAEDDVKSLRKISTKLKNEYGVDLKKYAVNSSQLPLNGYTDLNQILTVGLYIGKTIAQVVAEKGKDAPGYLLFLSRKGIVDINLSLSKQIVDLSRL